MSRGDTAACVMSDSLCLPGPGPLSQGWLPHEIVQALCIFSILVLWYEVSLDCRKLLFTLLQTWWRPTNALLYFANSDKTLQHQEQTCNFMYRLNSADVRPGIHSLRFFVCFCCVLILVVSRSQAANDVFAVPRRAFSRARRKTHSISSLSVCTQTRM